MLKGNMVKPISLTHFVSKLNAISATVTLGLDGAFAIVQSLSLPITINSSLRRLLADAPPEIQEKIREIGIAGVADLPALE